MKRIPERPWGTEEAPFTSIQRARVPFPLLLFIPSELSSREFEVLCLLVAGQSAEQIGELLFLSAKTIHNIHYQIKKKLQVSNDIELTKLAIGWGLTSPSITQ